MKRSDTGLSVRDLRVTYRDAAGKPFTALSVISLDVAPGAFLGIVGPSGSGKSTLLYALAGLGAVQDGSITWNDMPLGQLRSAVRDRWRREKVGFVFQNFNLVPELSPIQNVVLPAYFSRLLVPSHLRERGLELLQGFGVPLSRAVTGHLSRGEQQRVALARALLFDPPIILADEPTASLDTESALTVIDTLEIMAKRDGRTVLCVSHDPALIERCSRLIRLEHGVASEVAREPA